MGRVGEMCDLDLDLWPWPMTHPWRNSSGRWLLVNDAIMIQIPRMTYDTFPVPRPPPPALLTMCWAFTWVEPPARRALCFWLGGALALQLAGALTWVWGWTLPFNKRLSSGTCWTLRRVIPFVCVTNEREENVVKQHN